VYEARPRLGATAQFVAQGVSLRATWCVGSVVLARKATVKRSRSSRVSRVLIILAGDAVGARTGDQFHSDPQKHLLSGNKCESALLAAIWQWGASVLSRKEFSVGGTHGRTDAIDGWLTAAYQRILRARTVWRLVYFVLVRPPAGEGDWRPRAEGRPRKSLRRLGNGETHAWVGTGFGVGCDQWRWFDEHRAWGMRVPIVAHAVGGLDHVCLATVLRSGRTPPG